ncbi:hypothetical protein L218DRAFT_944247 [Marasmius fiardii PR-910]|nr:hypothetical protein L218DRAFT_944247 [Marasmius fiardii PR-910]
MHEIPPEILSYIFKHVVENNCFGRLNSRYSQQIGAFFLTKICSRWRAVALDTPGIWAHVCIRQVLGSPFDMRTEELKLELERLRLCIERARSFPLSLEVLVEEERPSIDYRNSKEGLTALLKEVTRKSDSEWGSLTVRMKRVQTNVCEDVFKMMKNDGNLEPLRRLEIHFDIIQNMESSLQAFQGAATFPNLRTLCLEHRPVGYTREAHLHSSSSYNPWRNIGGPKTLLRACTIGTD